MSSLAIAVPPPPLLECNVADIGPNINEEDGGPLLAQPPAVVIHPSNNNRRTIEEAQVACDELIGDLSNLDMGADDDTAAAPLLDPPAHRAIVIHKEDDEVEAVEDEALALVDGDTWPEDNNVIVRPEPERNVVVRRAVVQPALRPFRDFANLRQRHDHPGPPLHLTLLGTKRTSERYMARTRCFRLAPRAMPFEESDNEWGPPAFPVLDAGDSDNTSSSSTEDEE